MQAMKGVLLDADTLGLADLNWHPLQEAFTSLVCHDHSAPEEVPARAQGTDIILANKVALDNETLRQCQGVKLIVALATGTDNIDLDAAQTFNITVCNNRDYATTSLVEHSLALMLSLSRRLPAYGKRVEAGDWQRARTFSLLDPPIAELAGRTLGIIGAGASGTRLARLCRALGMRSQALQSITGRTDDDATMPRVALKQLLQSSDVISVHCPLTPQTRHLINAEALAWMKPTALLINTARGGIVDEAALAQALMDNHIAGAGVDALTQEPPVDGNPLLELDHPNLIVTPHNAWGSVTARQVLVDQTTSIIEDFKRGIIRNRVTPSCA